MRFVFMFILLLVLTVLYICIIAVWENVKSMLLWNV